MTACAYVYCSESVTPGGGQLYCSRNCKEKARRHRKTRAAQGLPAHPHSGGGPPPVVGEGERYGRLVVVAYAGSGSQGREYECRCDCGGKMTLAASEIRSRPTPSCGCYAREVRVARGRQLGQVREHRARLAQRNRARTRHGHARKGRKSPTYSSWTAMVKRCRLTTHRYYHLYGGRGITVCERWLSFDNFLADMGERPSGKTLDRLDPDGNYAPGNCRWATPLEQARTTRRALALAV